MKGQRLNVSALQTLFHVIRSPSLLLPHFCISCVSQIDFSLLHERGYKQVLFDKDNTLTKPYSNSWYTREIEDCIHSVVEIFGRNNVAIFSNTLGFVDQSLVFRGIDIVQHQNIQKPKGIQEVLNHFKCHEGNEVDARNIVMVGDRFSTDILFGNLNGMCTIYVTPLTKEGENKVVSLVRWFENIIVACIQNLGIKPPNTIHNLSLRNKVPK